MGTLGSRVGRLERDLATRLLDWRAVRAAIVRQHLRMGRLIERAAARDAGRKPPPIPAELRGHDAAEDRALLAAWDRAAQRERGGRGVALPPIPADDRVAQVERLITRLGDETGPATTEPVAAAVPAETHAPEAEAAVRERLRLERVAEREAALSRLFAHTVYDN